MSERTMLTRARRRAALQIVLLVGILVLALYVAPPHAEGSILFGVFLTLAVMALEAAYRRGMLGGRAQFWILGLLLAAVVVVIAELMVPTPCVLVNPTGQPECVPIESPRP